MDRLGSQKQGVLKQANILNMHIFKNKYNVPYQY